MMRNRQRVIIPCSASIVGSVVAVALLLLANTSSANICVGKKISPLRHVCGIVIDRDAAPIPNAKVKILKDGTEVVAVQTEANGKFNFQRFAAGNYEIQVEAAGFGTVRYKIVVTRPNDSCKKMLRIQLATGADICPDIEIIKQYLNPTENRRLNLSESDVRLVARS